MPVENQRNRFIISPAKSILIFDLGIATTISLVLILSPIILSVKIIAVGLLVSYGLVIISSFKQAVNSEVQYLPTTNQWLFNGQLASLRRQQFVTRNLVVLYFLTAKGERISQVIPSDSMLKKQHIQLRKLIIAWSRTTNRDGLPHPDRQN